jgi:putative endonuclease
MKSAFHYVYILVSAVDETIHYTGITTDLTARLKEHNQGNCIPTRKYRPWRIETSVAFRSESKACAFERYLKSGSGLEFARRHF